MRYAQNAATPRRVVRTVAELQMALEDRSRGQRIAELRKRKRMTQQAMAERLKIGYRTYQTWEAGTMPEWHNLERLAAALGTRIDYILGEETRAEESTLIALNAQALERVERKLDALLEALRVLGPTLPDEMAEQFLLALLQAEVDEQARTSGGSTAGAGAASGGSA